MAGLLQRRFIPAYAGNALDDSFKAISNAVHPRIRGERNEHLPELWRGCGSSPHTRGTLKSAEDRIAAFRFIPAYAGNATTTSRKRGVASVHPRIRGERTQKKMMFSG